jgi:phosphatidylglycerophosphate synthase
MTGATIKVTAQDVERVLPLKSWWAMVAVLPLVRPLTVLVVNHTPLTPNIITLASIALRLVSALLFWTATPEGLLAGAAAFYLAYLLDCMDGAVARLKGMSSEFGRFLDHVGDMVGSLVSLAALAAGQHLLLTPMVAAMFFLHLAEYYISFLTSTILATERATPVSPFWGKGVGGVCCSYRGVFHRRNMKSFISFPEYEAVVFLLFPVLGAPQAGIKAGFWLLLLVVSYTIFSTFIAVQTGQKKFP